jgi:hypothetical protein
MYPFPNDGIEQNYRPSPIVGGAGIDSGNCDENNDAYDSHLRHYHRPYPTIRGGQSSPTRFDAESSPRMAGPSPQTFATPMINRAIDSPYGERTNGMSGGQLSQSPTNHPPLHNAAMSVDVNADQQQYYDHRNSYNDPVVYQSQQQSHGHASYSKHPYHYGPSNPPRPSQMFLQNSAGFFSPYESHGQIDARQQANSMNEHHRAGHFRPNFPSSGHPYHAMSVDTPYSEYHHNPSLATSQRKTLETPVENPPTKRRRANPEKSSKKASAKPPRRKKMYSDYVGVTYNKTHAKYQACITHYRKQHYLGRYRLAVDAAKAYDDSAKLLKGENWKTNFESDNDYENAKAQEIEMIERQRMKTESNVSDAIGTQHEKNSQLVKQKLGLRMSLAHDTSFVAERMRSDRLEAVKKQAADHADQLKLNGVDLNKKSKSTRKKKGGDVNATGTEVVSNTLSLAFLHFLFWMCC